MAELILGGQRSGKTRRAESIAQAWLESSGKRRAVYIATAQAWDEEMRERIDRHRLDRSDRVPGMLAVEEPLHLADAIASNAGPETMVVVDCLTLWLTNLLMPAGPQSETLGAAGVRATALMQVISQTRSPLILISNEIGMGVIPLGRETREFVDELGRLNQQMATVCDRVTLMVAGLPLVLKDVA